MNCLNQNSWQISGGWDGAFEHEGRISLFFLLLLFLATKAERQPSLRLACRCCVGWGEKKGQLLNNGKNLKGCPRRRMKDSKEIQGNIFKGFDPGNLIVSSACNRNYFFRVAYLLWWRQLQLHRAPASSWASHVWGLSHRNAPWAFQRWCFFLRSSPA